MAVAPSGDAIIFRSLLLSSRFLNTPDAEQNMTIDRDRLKSLMAKERQKFVDERPNSKALFERASKSLLAGVPMKLDDEMGRSLSTVRAGSPRRSFLRCRWSRYIDLCLGDTGAMTGHSPRRRFRPSPSKSAVVSPSCCQRGCDLVAEELQKRFALPFWQFALTATDANRFSIRLARHITGRSKILVFKLVLSRYGR
jgi:glutamate-1-semialdehyde 2,1-aminomutase